MHFLGHHLLIVMTVTLKYHAQLPKKATYTPICDLGSENRPYDIFNPNGVISIML